MRGETMVLVRIVKECEGEEECWWGERLAIIEEEACLYTLSLSSPLLSFAALA
jgi:hypothetical protein